MICNATVINASATSLSGARAFVRVGWHGSLSVNAPMGDCSDVFEDPGEAGVPPH